MAFTYTHENLAGGDVRVVSMTGGVGGDTSAAIDLAEWADCSVQFYGTFGTSTVSIEGSNNGTNWAALNDAQGNALSGVNTAKIEQVLEAVRFKRVVVAAGTGTGLGVVFLCRRAQQIRT